MDFVGTINPPGKRIGVRYIITVIDYLKIWAEAAPVVNCTATTAVTFIFTTL